MRFLVTGATGNVGSIVAESLDSNGHEVIVAGSDVRELNRRFGAEFTVAHLDFHNPATFDCLGGVSGLFLLRPPQISRVGNTINPFIDRAVEVGVEHIVFSSVAGAGSNRIVPHHRIEQHIFASGLDWTILRPGFFAQNLQTSYRADIVEDDRIYLPAGAGRVAFIDTRDLGEIAARALTGPAHRGKAYHLTGAEAIGFDRVAEILSHALDREIAYEPASIPSYFLHSKKRGLPIPQALVQTILHTGLRNGDGAPVTDTVEQLLGRPPRSIDTYVADHLELFRK